MKQIIISSETKEAIALEKMADKATANSVSLSFLGCGIYVVLWWHKNCFMIRRSILTNVFECK